MVPVGTPKSKNLKVIRFTSWSGLRDSTLSYFSSNCKEVNNRRLSSYPNIVQKNLVMRHHLFRNSPVCVWHCPEGWKVVLDVRSWIVNLFHCEKVISAAQTLFTPWLDYTPQKYTHNLNVFHKCIVMTKLVPHCYCDGFHAEMSNSYQRIVGIPDISE